MSKLPFLLCICSCLSASAQIQIPALPTPTTTPTHEPTWLDPTTKLLWTASDNGSDLDQPQAVSYCAQLKYAGYTGWRLPSMEELQSLYDPDRLSTQQTVSNLVYNVHIKPPFELTTGSVWSSRVGDAPGKPYQGAWLLQFFDRPNFADKGKPLNNFIHFKFQMRALCVR